MASVRLPEATEARLAALARATKRSKSYHLKEALDYYFDRGLKREREAARWLEENKDAIDAHNRAIEKYGLPLKPLWEQDGAF